MFLAGAGALALSACGGEQRSCADGGARSKFSWKMVTTWPPNFPGLGTGVVKLADYADGLRIGADGLRCGTGVDFLVTHDRPFFPRGCRSD